MIRHNDPSTLTYTGRTYHFLDPQDEETDIIDIAHALSLLCRYNGATPEFYSVAEHSVIVSRLVLPEFAFDGLMHDAAEAYCGDVITPLKRMLKDYRAIIATSERAIKRKFCIETFSTAEVNRADTMAYNMERGELFPNNFLKYAGQAPVVRCLPPIQAEKLFLERYIELTEGRTT